MYAIDYDHQTEELFGLFAHATVDANMAAIQEHGLVRPDFNRVLDEVIAGSPELVVHRAAIASEVLNVRIPLGPVARDTEAVAVGAYFANRMALATLNADYETIRPHGGEVYLVAFQEVRKFLLKHGWQVDLKPRYATAKTVLIMLRVPLCFSEVEAVPTYYSRLISLQRDLMNNDLGAWHSPCEVKFLNSMPWTCVAWSGTFAEALATMKDNLVSPAASDVLALRFRAWEKARRRSVAAVPGGEAL